MKVLFIFTTLLFLNSCLENDESTQSKPVKTTSKSVAQVDYGFIIGEAAIVEVGLELSRKKDLLDKFKTQINRDFEGPCGEVMFYTKVKKFGADEIIIMQNEESLTLDKAHLVNDQVQIFDTNKKSVANISIPYGEHVLAVVKDGKGVVIKIKNKYFVFDNEEPKSATLNGTLKEMEFLDSSLFKGILDNSAYKQVLRDPSSNFYIVKNGPCT